MFEDEKLSSGSSRVVAWVITAILIAACLAAVFSLGRSSATAPTETAPTTTAPTTTTPTTTAATETVPEVVTINSLLGDVLVLSDTTFENGVRVLLICSIPYDDGTDAALEFVQLDSRTDYLTVAQRIYITTPTYSEPCGGCSITESHNFEAIDPVIYGSCLDGGSNRVGTAFAMSSPSSPDGVALNVILTCGGTSFTEREGELVLVSHAPKSASAEPTWFFPEMAFAHEPGSGFHPHDDDMLRRYCEVKYDRALAINHNYYQQARALPYDLIETEIGPLGLHSPVLIGFDDDTCSALFDVARENLWASDKEVGVVAELVGLDPPEGLDDWFVDCQK